MVLLQGCGGDDGPATGTSLPPAATQVSTTLPAVPESGPLKVEAFEPAAGPEGAVIALRGSGLTRGTKVRWGDVLLDTEFQSTTQVTFRLPRNDLDADVTHDVEAVREDGARAVASTSLTLEGAPLLAAIDRTEAEAGDVVRIAGRGLTRVTRVDVNGGAATVRDVAGDGTWLDIEVPEEADDGTIELWAQTRNYSAGYLRVTKPKLPLTIDDVKIGQTHLYSVGQGQKHAYMRFVAGKPTMVKVRLKLASGTQKVRPAVRLLVENNVQGARWFDMKGPAELGARAVAENDLANSYTLELDPSWMQRGFRFRVEARDKRYPSRISRASYTAGAEVPRRTFMRVHIVNLVPDGTSPATPDLAMLERALRAQFPLSDIALVKHPRHVKVPGTPFTDNEVAWLMALQRERVASGGSSSDFFFGFAPMMGSGVGFMPGRSAVLPARWIDNGIDYVHNAMMHELGHNLGRDHTWEDDAFPYWRNGVRAQQPHEPGALAGGPWRYHQGRMFDPMAFSDIMSYNQPMSISDFTYANILSQMPTDTRQRIGAYLAEPGASGPVCDGLGCGDASSMSLHVSGVMSGEGVPVRLDPLMAVPVTSEAVALEASAPRGPAEIEVRTSAGTFRFPLALAGIDHKVPTAMTAFSATIPAMRDIQSVQVVRDGKAVLTTLATPAPGTVASALDKMDARAVRTGWGSYRIDGRTLRMQWDARRYPWLSAWARVDGRTVPIAVTENGGVFEAQVDTGASEFIVTLSDGLNSEVHRIAR